FPMNYGDQDTSFSSFNVTVPTIGYYKQDQWRYNEVDGWGELILPGNTFQVLRVRSVLQQRDSIHVDQFGFGFATNRPQTVEYKWLAQGMDQPVLVVTTSGGFNTTARFYYDPAVTTGVAEAGTDGGGMIWPNPADDHLNIRLPDDLVGVLVVRDAAGR